MHQIQLSITSIIISSIDILFSEISSSELRSEQNQNHKMFCQILDNHFRKITDYCSLLHWDFCKQWHMKYKFGSSLVTRLSIPTLVSTNVALDSMNTRESRTQIVISTFTMIAQFHLIIISKHNINLQPSIVLNQTVNHSTNLAILSKWLFYKLVGIQTKLSWVQVLFQSPRFYILSP